MPFKFIEVPKDFECSLTQEIMVDPVFTADGQTYERAGIARWLEEHDTSPYTNERLEHKHLTPNRLLKSQISEFVEKNRSAFQQECIAAAKNADIATLRLLLSLGINVNIQDPDNGWTALHYAAYGNHQQMVALLLEKNCNIEQATASLDVSFEKRLLAAREEIAGLMAQQEGLNNELSILNLKAEVERYLKLSAERTNPAWAFMDRIEYYDSHLNNQLESISQTTLHGGSSGRTQAQQIAHLQAAARSQHACNIQCIYLQYAATINTEIKDVLSALVREDGMPESKPYCLDGYSYKQPITRLSYLEHLGWKEDKSAWQREITAFYQRYPVEALSRALKNHEERDLFRENQKRQEGSIIRRFHLLPIAEGEYPSNIQEVHQRLLKASPDVDKVQMEIRKLKIEGQLRVIGEKILKIDSDLQYFLPHTASQCTPLLLAASQGHTDMVDFLLNKNADPLKVDSCQATVFHWAARSGQPALVALLLNRGIDVQAQNRHGHKPLDIARAFGCNDCVALIESYLQEQQTLLNLGPDLRQLLDKIRALELQVQQLSAQQVAQSVPRSSADSQSTSDRVTFISDFAQASAARRASSPVLAEPQQPTTGIDTATCKL